MSDENGLIGARLNALLGQAEMGLLEQSVADKFGAYLSLLQRWNARVNLTAIRDEEGILARHFVESIACAQAIPVETVTVLDFGSGAGFPGIPIALCRPELKVTLAESQGKKAAFLSEAVRVLELTGGAGHAVKVHSGRAETLGCLFDCVTLRAVDQMGLAVRAAVKLVRPGGWLVPMTTGAELESIQAVAGECFTWNTPMSLPGGADRIVAMGKLTKA
jgi:16S rRNA (guanine527-N7)-methyltransferase